MSTTKCIKGQTINDLRGPAEMQWHYFLPLDISNHQWIVPNIVPVY